MYDFKTTGAQIQSRVQLLEEGEKNSKYCMNLEKSRQNKTLITSLKKDNNKITNIELILFELKDYYKQLYTESDAEINIDDYLENIDIPLLKSNQADICEGPISCIEMDSAINSMKLNKSPGSDRLTVEFYCKFWFKIKPLPIKSFTESTASSIA